MADVVAFEFVLLGEADAFGFEWTVVAVSVVF